MLPELLAVSASSPWLEGRYTYLHSTRTQMFTRFFPRCGIPDALADWADYAEFVRFLIATDSIREHTEIWWSVRPHQAFPTVETRICDAQPEFAEAVAMAGLMVALSAHFARALDEGRPLPDHPPRLLEENMWRAIRWGMNGELIDLEQGRVAAGAGPPGCASGGGRRGRLGARHRAATWRRSRARTPPSATWPSWPRVPRRRSSGPASSSVPNESAAEWLAVRGPA